MNEIITEIVYPWIAILILYVGFQWLLWWGFKGGFEFNRNKDTQSQANTKVKK
jgi:threonine/homoserine/homoserine lactone efflux protein